MKTQLSYLKAKSSSRLSKGLLVKRRKKTQPDDIIQAALNSIPQTENKHVNITFSGPE